MPSIRYTEQATRDLKSGHVLSAFAKDFGCASAQVPWLVQAPSLYELQPSTVSLPILRCLEIHWTETELQDGFVFYYINSGNVLSLKKEAWPAIKRSRGSKLVSTSVKLPVMPASYQNVVSPVSLGTVRRD